MGRTFKLTLREKKVLSKLGYDPKYFVKLCQDAESYKFLETTSGKELVVRR